MPEPCDASTNWLEGNLGIYYRSDHCYPATWVVQDIYLKTLSESDSVMTTPILSVITWGRTGEFSRGYLLFDDYPRDFYLLSLRGFDSASYLKTFGLTDADLSQFYFIKSLFSPYWWRLRLVVNITV